MCLKSAKSHSYCLDHTCSTVQRRDLNTLTTSLKENSSPIYIFCPGLWIRQTLDKIFLCQLNITCAESKVVCLHTPLARACSLVCNTTISHLIVISVFNNTIHASSCHPMSLDSSIILACSDTFVEN